MRHVLCRIVVIAVLCIGSVGNSFATDEPFIPIPEDQKALYHFDFKKWFYADEEARQHDLGRLKELIDRLTTLKAGIATDPKKLLEAIELKGDAGIIADRLEAYGGLRFAVNTNDEAAKTEGEDAHSTFEAATAYLEVAVQQMDDATLEDFVKKEPGLARYRFLLQNWRRNRPHTAPEPAEAVLARLRNRLDPFKSEYYNLMLGRTSDALIKVNERQLNVTTPGDFADLLRLSDRSLRESAFRKRLAAFKQQEDLYAFALFQKAKTANAVADERKFGNASDAALFGYYLTPETLDVVLTKFREHADLAIRFQRAEQVYQEKLLGLEDAKPWDLEARPANAPEPRFVIRDASMAVTGATKVFGPDYQREISDLLEPRNGRLDIVAGENRDSGDYTWGAHGPSWVFYMQGYHGYLADVVTLAHECAHAVHHRLLYAAGVPWHYGDGARYFNEGFAKVNELLVLDELAKNATTKAERLFYLRELNSKLASVKFAAMYWAAYATAFETEVYRRVQSEAIKKPQEIHDVWAQYGRLWQLDFDKYPDLKYTWAGTHHFFDTSRYYSNYLFAWILAVSVYERLESNPEFAGKFVDLMKAGFSDEPAILLRTRLDIDLADPEGLERIFALVEKRLVEFEDEVKKF